MSNYKIIQEIYNIIKNFDNKSVWDKDAEEEMEQIKLLIEKKRPQIR